MKKIDQILKILKDNGCKITPSRLEIISILTKTSHPLSADDIYEKMKDTTDRVTVYRNLHLFESIGLVTKISLKNHHSYELTDNHGHYIVCQNCNQTEKIPVCNIKHLEDQTLKLSKSFSLITGHVLQMSGFCKKCKH